MTTRTAPEPAAQTADPHPRRWLALGVMLSAAFMNLLDGTIVTVALPVIRESFGADYAASQWLITSYTLAFGAGLITGGRLGDRFGRKLIFLLGVICFTLASTACGLAPTMDSLIIARAVQGLAAALMVPQIMATVYAVFPLRERGAASGAFGAVTGLAGVAGPMLGGVFIAHDLLGLGWRAIFLVNVPIGCLAVLATLTIVPDTRSGHPLRMDLIGMLLVTAGLLCVLFPLIQGRDAGWPTWMLVSLAVSPVLLLLYTIHARAKDARDQSALVPPRLFALRGFSASAAILFVSHVVVIGFFVAISITLQLGFGYSALRTGMIFLPWAVGAAVAAQFLQWAVPVLGRRLPALGALVTAVGLGWFVFALDAGSSWWEAAPGQFLGGFGTVSIVGPAFMFAGSRVAVRDAGSASGTCNASVQLGGAVGTALLGVLLFSPLAVGAAQALNAPATATTGGGMEELVASTPDELRGEVFVDALRSYSGYAAGGLALVALLSFALPRDAFDYRK